MTNYSKINIHKLLAKRRLIAHLWGVEDVQAVRPDLNDDEAWKVLQAVERYKDSEYGITWDVVAAHAEVLFGYADFPYKDEAEE